MKKIISLIIKIILIVSVIDKLIKLLLLKHSIIKKIINIINNKLKVFFFIKLTTN